MRAWTADVRPPAQPAPPPRRNWPGATGSGFPGAAPRGRGLLQRLRERAERDGQSLLRPPAVRAQHRGVTAPRGRAADHRASDEAYAAAPAARLRGDARAAA